MKLLIFLLILAVTLPQTLLPAITIVLTLVLGLFWKKLSGYKTIIVGTITTILGYMSMFDTTVLTLVSNWFHVSLEWLQGLMILIIGILNIFLRKFQDPAVPAGNILDIPKAIGRAIINK